MEPQVLNVTFFQDKLLVVFHQIHEGLVAIFPLDKQMAAVFCWAFFEPHVVVDRGGDQISPPVVASRGQRCRWQAFCSIIDRG